MKRRLAFLLSISLLLTACLSGCGISDVGKTARELEEIGKEISQDIDEVSNQIRENLGDLEDLGEDLAVGLEPVEDDDSKTKEEAAEAYQLVVDHVSGDRYAYSTLDEETKQVYDEVYYAIQNFETDFEVSTLSLDVLDHAFNAVTADYGELFWVYGYSYRNYYMSDSPDVYTKIEFTPTFTMTESERDSYMAMVESAAEGYLSEASLLSGDYAKVMYLFERLITDVDYVVDSPENQNILSVFLYGETVCSGYANALQYLCNRLGIPCAIIKGTAKNESHAWNLVYMDGGYYYVDVTWGNAAYSLGEAEAAQHYYINYAYFGLTSSELARTHVDNGKIALPDCTATADNYHIRNGFYYNSWDANAIGGRISSYYNGGYRRVSLKFSDYALFNQVVDYMLTQGNIVDYCPGMTSLKYIANDTLYVLDIEFY